MNARYRRGVRFERRIVDLLRGCGWVVIRSPASKGSFDVIACRSGTIYLIQAKLNGRASPGERRKLIESARLAGGEPILASRSGRDVIFEHLLTSDRWVVGGSDQLIMKLRRAMNAKARTRTVRAA